MQHRWYTCLVLASIEVLSPAIAFLVCPRSRVITPASAHGALTTVRSLGDDHRWIARRPGLDLRSYEGDDFPSDVGDTQALPASVLTDDNPELRETMKREILSIAATSNRFACVCVRVYDH